MGTATIAEVEKPALDLSEAERGLLASHLLRSLPPPEEEDDDEGIAEALRREAELEANPEIGITIEQLDEMIASESDKSSAHRKPPFLYMTRGTR